MSNNKELTNAEALEIVHKFGHKCYLKGYKRANLEWLVCIGGLIAVWAWARHISDKDD